MLLLVELCNLIQLQMTIPLSEAMSPNTTGYQNTAIGGDSLKANCWC